MSAPALVRPVSPTRSTVNLVIVPNGSSLLAYTTHNSIVVHGTPWSRPLVEDFALSVKEAEITCGTIIVAMPDSPDATHFFSGNSTAYNKESFYSDVWAIDPFTSVTVVNGFDCESVTIFGDPSDPDGLHVVIATAEVFPDPDNRNAAESWLLRKYLPGIVVGNLPFDHVLTPLSVNCTSLALAAHTRINTWFATVDPASSVSALQLRAISSVLSVH